MKMYDVTAQVYTGMPVYKNTPAKQPSLTTVTNDYITESRIDMDVHSGTHVDAPLHMINDGETIETISIEDLVGQCKVFDLTEVEDQITKKDIEKFDIQENDFVIFKTKNSYDEEFNFEFIFVNEEAATYLAEKGIKGVGVDALGIERSQPGHPTHKTLFTNDVIIIEGLRLKEVAAGEYFMVAAPIKLQGCDAAPARVLLFEGM
ncbi:MULTISPECIES: cyclase family protein [Bacillaceae]|uniref:cyclase family protein n=1 Tax=Bacillaceae TaxID=186817 RepID=UPI002A12AEEA|nr:MULTISPECIES: cyclase family protein [unclassified Cytobacillus]MDX8359694.1 cyclase family protein [Cytobacillus sp. IB215316]MDX8364335.1 cyclase family protein [Cytobacillus sp. IB215665]